MASGEKDEVASIRDLCLVGAQAMHEFLTYRGSNKEYLNRAKVGCVAVGAYVRLRATMANERSITLLEQRTKALDVPPIRAALPVVGE